MLLVHQSVQILAAPEAKEALLLLEQAFRICHKSEEKIGTEPNLEFILRCVAKGHLSPLEHVSATLKLITSRGITHELVRHRIASFSQESTRWISYVEGLTCVIPFGFKLAEGYYDRVCSQKLPLKVQSSFDHLQESTWLCAMFSAETAYRDLITFCAPPQIARGVLPTDLKAEIITTMNLREWRHVLALRAASSAHPQFQELSEMIMAEFRRWLGKEAFQLIRPGVEMPIPVQLTEI